jgi:MscS family membrane protein
MKWALSLSLAWACAVSSLAQAPKTAPAGATPDTLGRDNPRSSVTGFLEACHNRDYQKAAQYLDLKDIPARTRSERGPQLAKQLEAILNSTPSFSAVNLSQNPQGDLSSTGAPMPVRVATVTQNSQTHTLELERIAPQRGAAPIWLFSADSVAAIPSLTPASTAPYIAHYLPGFMVSSAFLETSLWKWLALILAAALLLTLSRQVGRLLALILRSTGNRFRTSRGFAWIETIIQPARVILCLAVFRIAVEVIDPSAIARLYIGRAIELILVWSIAWWLTKLVDLFLGHVEAVSDSKQQAASRSMLRMGRRVANATIIVFAILLILSNWGYNTTTLIAGLGVGGIAIALSAQQTIANVFGGVSVIGDHPIGIGDFGNFGGLIGTVEDIGMRSTRIRTLSRTIVSVPNSSLAGFNLENYSERDKILFNPTFQIKRSTPDEQIRALIDALPRALRKNGSVELGPMPVRLTGLASTSFNLEIFCYVLTRDVNQFYKIQGELFLAVNDALHASNVELA